MSGIYGFELAVGYNSYKGSFNSTYSEIKKVDKNQLEVFYHHQLDFSLKDYSFEANVKTLFFERLALSAGVGIIIGGSSTFSQFEQIEIPKGELRIVDSIYQAKGRFISNEESGSLPGLNNTRFFAGAKVGYDLPVTNSRNIMLRPELGISYVLTPIIQNITWNMVSIKFGVSLFYSTSKAQIGKTEAIKMQDEKIEQLNKQYESKLTENRKLEENIQLLKDEHERCERLLAEKENILKNDTLAAALEKSKIESERLEMNTMIDEENKLKGRKCDCYVILFLSTTNKDAADRLKNQLLTDGVNYVMISQFNDPYMNETYYRVQSRCYDNHNDAFDDKIKIRGVINKLNLNSQIRCDK